METLRYGRDWKRCAMGEIGNVSLLERWKGYTIGEIACPPEACSYAEASEHTASEGGETLRYWKDWKRCAIGKIDGLHGNN